ncbi:MAG: hypothetical protein AAGA09_03270 [Pseudomonadota bacterium]
MTDELLSHRKTNKEQKAFSFKQHDAWSPLMLSLFNHSSKTELWAKSTPEA